MDNLGYDGFAVCHVERRCQHGAGDRDWFQWSSASYTLYGDDPSGTRLYLMVLFDQPGMDAGKCELNIGSGCG